MKARRPQTRASRAPRKPRDKSRTHERILDSAARLFRTKGVAQTSVADVMEGAGLTVGGFYAHFESKDALVEATLRRAMEELRPVLLRELDRASEWRRLEVVLQRYLSRDHRDNPPGGCPLPAMVAELSATGDAGRIDRASGAGEEREREGRRNADRARKILAEEFEQNVRLIAGSDAPEARARMLGLLALMVGGVALSRALKGTPLSDELLKACRDTGRAAMRGSGLRPEGETLFF